MKTGKKAILGIAAFLIVFAACASLVVLPKAALGEEAEGNSSNSEQVFYPTYVKEGYTSMVEWKKDVRDYSDATVTKGQNILNNYKEYFSEEEQSNLQAVIDKADISNCFTRLNEYSAELDSWETKGQEYKKVAEEKAAAEAKAAEEAKKATEAKKTSSASTSSGKTNSTTKTYASSGSGLTKSSGVNYHNGRKETYYSSRVLHHYRTNEWTLDSEGFYRTSEGYYVVAASDKKQGSTFQGSKGVCQVLDSGCASGTTDYYVGW